MRGSCDWASLGEMRARQGGPFLSCFFLSKGREDVTGISDSNSIRPLSCHMESIFKDFISLRGRGYQAVPVPDIVRMLDSHTKTGAGDSLPRSTLLPLEQIRQLLKDIFLSELEVEMMGGFILSFVLARPNLKPCSQESLSACG